MSTGLLSAIPYLVATVTMVFIGRHSDQTSERRWHIVGSAMTAAIGFAVVPLAVKSGSTALVILAWCVAAMGVWGSLAPFWALTSSCFRARAAAGSIAIVNSIGSLSGFVAPSVIGYAKEKTGSFAIGLFVVAAALICGAGMVLLVPRDRG